jgi:hypothetical protein
LKFILGNINVEGIWLLMAFGAAVIPFPFSLKEHSPLASFP